LQGVLEDEGGIRFKRECKERNMRKVMVLLLVCAAPVFGQNAKKDFRTAAGCGPAETQFSASVAANPKTLTPPPAGSALVYVIEVERPDDAGITTRVGLDGNWIGANRGRAYLAFEVEPGERHVCVDWQSSIESRQRLGGAAVLMAEAGKTYFFRAEVLLSGATIGHNEDMWVEPVDEAEGMWLVSKAGKSEWKEGK
jgi:hypothetical protein